jgi:pectate lyase
MYVLPLLLAAPLALTAAPAPAFPGAEGFGAGTLGGRGGATLLVTNLDDYDPRSETPVPGSLRAACDATGPRIVSFQVSGTIALKATLRISQPWLTLAGQMAPGGGICLKNYATTIHTHDVIVRYLRFRPGDEMAAEYHKQGKAFEPDALSIDDGSRDVIVDHCSASWAIDECLSVSGEGITNVTVQWCIISESLNHSLHSKGAHGYGSLIRCNGNVTFHHNLYAHHNSRTPRPGTYGDGCILLDFRNNLIYDAIRGGYTSTDPARINYVGNCIKGGPSSVWNCAFSVGGDATRIYAEDNHVVSLAERQKRDWELISHLKDVNRQTTPFAAAPVDTDTPERAYERILAECGATLPVRDAVDARIVAEVRSGKGRVIDSQSQVGGWPRLTSAPAPPDSDNHGASRPSKSEVPNR